MLANKALSAAPSAVPLYVESVFSTYLYTGNGSTQTITNNIDLSGEGGLVWIKKRSASGDAGNDIHSLCDTQRGNTKYIFSNLTNSESTASNRITSFNADGFSLGADSSATVNQNSQSFVSWTFRKAKKFFDVVTYTGNGSARTISHNLGSVPGCIMVKRTDTTGDWQVYHRANTAAPETDYLVLNTTAATADSDTRWNDTLPTSTEFSLGTDATVNANTGTYVAYLFAHDAGGFGESGSDNVISCGSYTGNGSTTGPTVTLGYEPQWLLVKRTDSAYGWLLADVMRTMDFTNYKYLVANDSGAEGNWGAAAFKPLATGFQLGTAEVDLNANGGTYIYIAIRRGPMKTPESGTSVFSPITATASTGTSRTIGFPSDMSFGKARTISANNLINDRLRGYANSNTTAPAIYTDLSSAEDVSGTSANVYNVWNTTALDGAYFNNYSTIWYHFRRAPGFFDVVCYTGTGSNTTFSHNLGVAPELMIVKRRGTSNAWAVYANNDNTDYLVLNTNAATVDDNTYWNDTSPTSSVFSVGTNNATNASGSTYVAYLFASLTGISKVGTYTGNGSSQTINCGFTAGARFILIKRTDSTGDWYVYDSARGIVSGNDPQLKVNSDAAEATGYDAVDPDNSGFIVNNDATNFPINVNNATYIYLAIA